MYLDMNSSLDTPLERISENYISQYYRFEDFLEEDADIVYTFNEDTDEIISFYNRHTNLHFEAPPTLEEYSNYDESLPIADYSVVKLFKNVVGNNDNELLFTLSTNLDTLAGSKVISNNIYQDPNKVSLSAFSRYALMFPTGCKIEFKG